MMQVKRYNLTDGLGYTFDEDDSWEAEDGVFCRASEVERLTAALEGMVWQFAYRSGHGTLYSGGLSALEEAFEVLGWDDPYKVDPSHLCDEPGCRRFSTCGTPTPGGYRSTCSEHRPPIEEA